MAITEQKQIAGGTYNRAQEYNDNVTVANANDETLQQQITEDRARPTVRKVNGTSPNAAGEVTLPQTSASAQVSTAATQVAAGTAGRFSWLTDAGALQFDNGASWSPIPLGFGDGTDGDVTVTGTVTLTRDMSYRTLTVAGGGTLVTRGFIIRAQRQVSVLAGGTIHDDGSRGYDCEARFDGEGSYYTKPGYGGSGGGGGQEGTRGSQAFYPHWGPGGGGGGGGGVVVILTPLLINAGTIRVNGGSGGAGFNSRNAGPDGSVWAGVPPTPSRVLSSGPYDYTGLGAAPDVQTLGTSIPPSLLLYGGLGGSATYNVSGDGGDGGLILTFTGKRVGAGTYSATGGAGNTNGLPGTIKHHTVQ